MERDSVRRELLGDVLCLFPDLTVCGMAADGLEGLDMALNLNPDAIVMELLLPGLSGLGVLREYRSRGGQGAVVVLTSVSAPSAWSAALAAGASMILLKPVAPIDLVQQLRTLCGGMRAQYEKLLARLEGGGRGCLGRSFAARGAELLRLQPDMQLKAVYIQIAHEEHTTPLCVEKNIRKYAACLSAGALRDLGMEQGKKATNGSFLRALAQAAKIPL